MATSRENLPGMQSSVQMAQKVGKELGGSKIL